MVGVQVGTTYMEAAQKIPGIKEVRTYQRIPTPSRTSSRAA